MLKTKSGRQFFLLLLFVVVPSIVVCVLGYEGINLLVIGAVLGLGLAPAGAVLWFLSSRVTPKK